MKSIDILYHETDSLPELSVMRIKKLCDKTKREINIEFCKGYEIINKSVLNPDYDFIVIHLGKLGFGEDPYEIAKNCRTNSKAVLVAESCICPDGKEEILQYFDEYIGHLDDESLEMLLENFGFTSEFALAKEKTL